MGKKKAEVPQPVAAGKEEKKEKKKGGGWKA